MEGFEPPTSCSQSRRATRLRYTPMTEGSAPARRAVYRHCELSAMRNKTPSHIAGSLPESRPFLRGISHDGSHSGRQTRCPTHRRTTE